MKLSIVSLLLIGFLSISCKGQSSKNIETIPAVAFAEKINSIVLIVGFVRKNIWALLFGILVIVNFLVESMLQTEAGNLFFVFFYCLIIAAKKTELSNVS